VPAFGFYDFAKSDSDGNMYVHPSEGYAQAVLRIAVSSSEPTLYALPVDLRDKFNLLDFAVTARGSVWVVADTTDHARTVAFEFDSKGQVKNRAEFDLPQGVNVYSFLASDQGTLLLSGLYGEMAAENLRGRSYVALFDQSGTLLRKLDEPTVKVDLGKMSGAPQENGATVGDDGSFYLLDSKQITVLNPAGKPVRRIPISKPAAGLRLAGLYVSGGLAAVRLARLEKDHRVSFSYMVLNLFAKQPPLGWYAADPSIGDAAVAFSRAEGFTFYHVEQGTVHFIRAQLR